MKRQGIPEELVETVLQRADIVEVIGRYVQLAPSGRYWKGLCPFHGEKSPSFTVTPEKRIYHCFGCGKGGNAIHFLMQIEGWTYFETVRTLAQEASIPIDHLADQEPEDEFSKQKAMMSEAHLLAKTFYNYILNNTEEGQSAREYMQIRNFGSEHVNAFELGYAPARKDALVQLLKHKEFPLPLMEQAGLIMRNQEGQWIDRFRDRFMFPIFNAKGKAVGFGGRILGDGQPKYLNSSESPVFHKGRLLYRLSEAKHEIRKSGEAVLFEGYVDVIRAWEAGVTNGVASLGTAFTDEHAHLLKRIAAQVTICYDGDEAGQTAAEKAAVVLQKHGLRVRVAVMPPKQDPDSYILEFGAEKFRGQILAQALSVPSFQLQRMRGQFKMHEAEGTLAFVQAALNYLAVLPLPADREFYTKELSTQVGISQATLNEQMIPMVRKNEKAMERSVASERAEQQARQRSKDAVPDVLPAYMNAERHLLTVMLSDANLAHYVQQTLEDDFIHESHAAIASYLYAYYASGHAPDGSAFLLTLHDERLERIVSGLLIKEPVPLSGDVLRDYISQIQKARMNIERKHYAEQLEMAKRADDFAMGTELTLKIMSLDKKLRG